MRQQIISRCLYFGLGLYAISIVCLYGQIINKYTVCIMVLSAVLLFVGLAEIGRQEAQAYESDATKEATQSKATHKDNKVITKTKTAQQSAQNNAKRIQYEKPSI